MSFVAPTLLGSLALVPVYVWLRLRQRRPPVAVVSSLLLWKAVPPAPQEALARRERLWNLVLLIEGISLALVCAALARPFVMRETTRPVHLVLGIDDSASMGAGDRWDRAWNRAKALVESLHHDDLVTLLTGDEEITRVTPTHALGTLPQFAPRKAEDDLEGLLARARALAGVEDGTVVRVLTDRVVPDAPEIESFGGPVDNAGIVDASYDGKEIFLLLAATSPRRSTIKYGRVRTEREPGRHDETAVEIADDRSPCIIPFEATGQILVVLKGRGDLFEDDMVVFDPIRRARVRIDTPGNPELVRAVSVQPGIEVVQGVSGEADLVVLDRAWPGEFPKGPCVVIAPPQDCPLRGEEVKGPIESWDASDHLLREIDPAAVGLVKARAFVEPPGWTEGRVLATAGGKPILVTGRLGDTRVLYIGFDVSLGGGESTWATHPHFPVFWNSVLGLVVGRGATTWTRTGLCSRKETLCAGLSTPSGPVDFARTRVVSSPRFFTAHALAAAALGFSFAFLLARKANGWRSSSSSTTR